MKKTWGRTAAAGLMLAAALAGAGALAQATGKKAAEDRPGPARDQTEPAATLPGGASSLTETYRDWQVSCTIQNVGQGNAGKHCAMSQTQVQKDSGQRALALELEPLSGGGVAGGTLSLPFGLALDAGVTLQVDDTPAGRILRFRTCLPAGCMVPLSFDAAQLTAMRGGATLKVRAVGALDGAEVLLPVSLQGFGPALDRLAALAGP